jgi:hypothetical protein
VTHEACIDDIFAKAGKTPEAIAGWPRKKASSSTATSSGFLNTDHGLGHDLVRKT